jgi:glutamate-5-semialdehyde dehydrogenase
MTGVISSGLEHKGIEARVAARVLASMGSDVKNLILYNIAEMLESDQKSILRANAQDMESGRRDGLSEALLDRLFLDGNRLVGMAAGIRAVAALPDPVGEELDTRTMPNGLVVSRRSVPIGVVGVIYESRPNVTVDIASLCLKSGNACILRGGSEALNSNIALTKLISYALKSAGGPDGAVQFLDDVDRSLVPQMLQMREYIDLMIPRGGAELVRFVSENAVMPAVTGGIGVCHTYVDATADIDMAAAVVTNAKVRRPSVCNALDTLLVHVAVASLFLPRLAVEMARAGVELRCDTRATDLMSNEEAVMVPARLEDWGKEFMDLILAVKVVDSMDEALRHIEQYGSGHSEAILTKDASAANRFLYEVDASAVFLNTSTGFNDGFEFGLGAEIAISTSKYGPRGPMGLRELTAYKWVVVGSGQLRG